ncbi:MAG: vWA domain-containing protein [Verrucomicrobiales bacterium]
MDFPFRIESFWRYVRECQFAEPAWFWLLALLPVLAFLRGARGAGPAVTFSSLHLLRQIARPGRSALGMFSAALPYLTLALGIAALARPQHVRTQENITSSGIEVMLTIDVSLSMSIEDFTSGGQTVNRMSVAKRVCRDFIAGRPSDRIGLVAFAGRPYVASPLTLDHQWLRKTLEEQVRMGAVEDGTAIGSGIAAATRRLDSRNKDVKSKVIVLLTDGSNNSGNIAPLDAARFAQNLGIKVYAIAVGTEGYHRIPLPDRSGRYLPGMRQEFDTEIMKRIADMTGGQFFRAQDTSGLERIFGTIDRLEKTEIKRQTLVERDELFEWFVGAAFFTAAIGMALRQTLMREIPA